MSTMSTCVIVAILCLFTVKNVLSLHCYSTDLDRLQRNASVTVYHYLQSCDSYADDKIQLQREKLPEFSSSQMVCFSVEIDIDVIGNIIITGCHRKDDCELMKLMPEDELVSTILQGSIEPGVVKWVQCKHCEIDACNSVAGPVAFSGVSDVTLTLVGVATATLVGVVLATVL